MYLIRKMLYEKKNSAPFNGKFDSICANKNYSFGGTWKQHSKTSQGYGEGSRKDGEKITFYFAERKGFEPPVPVKVQLLSREPHSTTLAPLQNLKSMN